MATCALAALAAAMLAGVGCGSSSSQAESAFGSPLLAHWSPVAHVTQVVDLTGARSDGRLLVAADARLGLWRPGAPVDPFARGPDGYVSTGGGEPYLALSPGGAVRSRHCAFPRDTAFVLSLNQNPGVVAVDRQGRARPFAALPGSGLLSGIAFDRTGRFGHRLLVARVEATASTVFAVDCRGGVKVVTHAAPKVEGGMVVAPATFGSFAGQLIAPDENSGRIFAIAANGSSRLLADSGLPKGGDVGAESAGFVPRSPGRKLVALLADRSTPGNPHPGDDMILALGGSALRRAGVAAGDLLVATEGGARTVAVRCRRTCRVREVADGPTVAHAEGHIVFVRAR